jgi:hypothetical protein
MLGGAREFRYDWILLRARNLPRLAVFELIRGHGSKTSAVLCAFDLLRNCRKVCLSSPLTAACCASRHRATVRYSGSAKRSWAYCQLLRRMSLLTP